MFLKQPLMYFGASNSLTYSAPTYLNLHGNVHKDVLPLELSWEF